MGQGKLFSLGIEEEFQIVSPKTGQLRSRVAKMLEDGKMVLKEQIKAELHQSVVETGSEICDNIKDATDEVLKLRRHLKEVAANHGLKIAAAGTHPFSRWEDQKITDDPRYHGVVQDMQQVARANLIFGLHVHVGVPEKDIAIHIMNAARYFLPHIFALSTNSPFWNGINTGLQSYRIKVFDRFPRTGIPDYFNSYQDFQSYVDILVKTGCIDNAKKIWWDIRPHPFYDTLEFRICDVPMRYEVTICLAALIQAVVAKLYKLIKQNLGFRLYRRLLINENKWRAARYGIEGKMIDFGKKEEVLTTDLLMELLEFVDDVLDDLNSREEVHYLKKIIERGTGARRQLRIWDQTQSTKAVVQYIIDETNRGL